MWGVGNTKLSKSYQIKKAWLYWEVLFCYVLIIRFFILAARHQSDSGLDGISDRWHTGIDIGKKNMDNTAVLKAPFVSVF